MRVPNVLGWWPMAQTSVAQMSVAKTSVNRLRVTHQSVWVIAERTVWMLLWTRRVSKGRGWTLCSVRPNTW